MEESKKSSKNLLNATMKIPLNSLQLPIENLFPSTDKEGKDGSVVDEQGISSEVYEGLQLTPSSCDGEDNFLSSASDDKLPLAGGGKQSLAQTARPARGPSEAQDLTGLCLWLTLRAAMQLSVHKK
eukprot:766476-Hanusia_phi.AAC.2